ncbi:MAG: riboflavin biosynthesis protein RibF [Planctomycetota bacterium]|nr:riboflavin biosynthesis protein RibF [Planctomycetota bacterium]
MDWEIIQGLEKVPDSLRRGVLTVGNFDGVHLGHQRLLSVAASLSASEDAKFCVLTFDPPPAVVLAPNRAPDYILPADVKYRLLAAAGPGAIVVVRTTTEFLAGTAEQFIRDVLVKYFEPKHLVEGPNFFFGRDRSGNVETLQEMSGRFGFDVTVVEPLEARLPKRGAVHISSSLVRDLIRAGDVADAALCLGRHFTLYGTVVTGCGHGRLLEFPTANVDPNGLICPGEGVYAAWADIQNERYSSAVSVGAKPTFEMPSSKTIEVHLLDAAGNFYGSDIAVTFLSKLRDQQAFPDTGALKAQIAKDVQRVRELCE